MKTATVHSAVLFGLEAQPVTVTARRGSVEYAFKLVGFPSDAASRETRVRVSSALGTLGVTAAGIQVTVAPPSGASGLDLPIAVAVLAAMGRVPEPDGLTLLAELGLDGRLRPVRGVLCVAERQHGAMVVAPENGREAALGCPDEVWVPRTLAELVASLRGETCPSGELPPPVEPAPCDGPDLSEVRGHAAAKRALEVAAAGGHGVLSRPPEGPSPALSTSSPRTATCSSSTTSSAASPPASSPATT